MPKKDSLLNQTHTSSLNNSFINHKQKTERLPETSLRIKGDTHSKINALKKVEMTDSLNEILDVALDEYVQSLPKDKQIEIKDMVDRENEYKLRKARKKNKQS